MSRNEKAREQSLSAAVNNNRSKLSHLVRRGIRDQIESDDVLQDVFVEYLEAYDLGLAIDNLGAWLVRVAQNKILDRFRRRKTQERYKGEAQMVTEEMSAAPKPDEGLAQKLLREEILAAIEALPPEQREVFVQHELEGKSFEEIAQATGVSINTLLSRKRYAIMALRATLKEVYDELE